MADNYISNTQPDSALMQKLLAEKKSGRELQKRKHTDWDENYELYRNRVKTNRLTQRQAVNIPLMKETVKTLLSRIDDPPNVEWKELSGDEYKELIYQEIWNQQMKDNNVELIDILDKKNVLLYGLSVKKLNLCDDGIETTVQDIYDTIFDPLMKPWDIDSARFVVFQNIFRSVREILADPKYSDKGKEQLKIWVDSTPGITQSNLNREQWEKKMERSIAMGIANADFPLYAGGDRIINLSEHLTNIWDTKTEKFVKRVVIYADDKIELYNETLKECLGIDFWPCVLWSEDPETNDTYPDSVADLVRTPNKVLNVWFSQEIENRTLKNFNMHWFIPGQNYTPQTYTPGPGMMLPAPPGEDINKVLKPVEVGDLSGNWDAISALTNIVERGSGATALEKGQAEPGSQTLGEIQILVGKANERTTAMAKFYRLAWYELAWKWDKMMHANAPAFLKLYKQSQSGKIYPKRVYSKDWISDVGYEPTVRSTSEQETETTKGIQKFLFILQQFPNNPALREIAQKRMLEMVDLTPEELKQVSEAEQQAVQQPQAAPVQPNPQDAQLQQQIQGQLQQLNA